MLLHLQSFNVINGKLFELFPSIKIELICRLYFQMEQT